MTISFPVLKPSTGSYQILKLFKEIKHTSFGIRLQREEMSRRAQRQNCINENLLRDRSIASQQGKDRLFILGAGTNGDPQGTGTLRPHLTPHADSRWTPGLHVNNKCFTHGEENLEYFYDFRVRNGFSFKYTFCSLQHA